MPTKMANKGVSQSRNNVRSPVVTAQTSNVVLDARSSGIAYSQGGASLIEVIQVNDGKSTGQVPSIKLKITNEDKQSQHEISPRASRRSSP